MIDIVLGLVLILIVYRGYRRGLIREGADLLLLVVGALIAFRTGEATAAFFGSWTGASPLVARTIGSFAVFFAIQLGGSFLIRRFLRLMGPTRVVDRIGGAAVSGLWFAFLASLMLLVASALPLSGTPERLLADSTVADLVAGEDAFTKQAVSSIVGDRVLESLVNLNQLIGDQQVVIEGAERVEIPVLGGDLVEARDEAQEVFELLNLARIDAGEDPLAWSDALAEVASGHGFEMYREGYFSHVSAETGTVADRVAAFGIPTGVVGENLALSPTAASVHEGLLASPGHRANMLNGRFTRVGIAAIQGPLGLMVVQVFTG